MADEVDEAIDFGEEVEEATRLLPAWFVTRMMTDHWFFGLLTDTGIIIGVEHIRSVNLGADGLVWLDVTLLSEPPLQTPPGMNLLIAPTDRTDASIAASHIVAVFELADT